MRLEKVIKAMEDDRCIFGFDMLHMEHLGVNPDRKVKCKVYHDNAFFAPLINFETELTESEINEIIDYFKVLWVWTDSDYLRKHVYRYFALQKPFSSTVCWTKAGKE